MQAPPESTQTSESFATTSKKYKRTRLLVSLGVDALPTRGVTSNTANGRTTRARGRSVVTTDVTTLGGGRSTAVRVVAALTVTFRHGRRAVSGRGFVVTGLGVVRETVLAVVLAKVVFVASGVTVVGEVASGRGCVLLDLHELK